MFFDVDPLDAMDALHGYPPLRADQPGRECPGGFPALGPLEYLASNLFAARFGGDRETCCRKPLVTLEAGPGIRFSGERFDQDDLDVFLACLEPALANTGAGTARFEANRLLRRLGRRVDGPGRRRLTASLWRLEAGRLELADAGRRACIRLFNTVLVDRQGGWCMVEVHAQALGALAAMPGLAGLLRDRPGLKGCPLSKWLLCFGRALPEELVLDLHRLRALCGCPEETHARFTGRVRAALDRLADNGYLTGMVIGPDGLLRSSPAPDGTPRGTPRSRRKEEPS